eukprot:228549_1
MVGEVTATCEDSGIATATSELEVGDTPAKRVRSAGGDTTSGSGIPIFVCAAAIECDTGKTGNGSTGWCVITGCATDLNVSLEQCAGLERDANFRDATDVQSGADFELCAETGDIDLIGLDLNKLSESFIVKISASDLGITVDRGEVTLTGAGTIPEH